MLFQGFVYYICNGKLKEIPTKRVVLSRIIHLYNFTNVYSLLLLIYEKVC